MTRPSLRVGPPTAEPLWIYVIMSNGEIIVGAEAFGVVKHASLSGGEPVWAAGQIGILRGQIRLADLRSGHYIGGRVEGRTPLAGTLRTFTREVFQGYCGHFGIQILASQFECIFA